MALTTLLARRGALPILLATTTLVAASQAWAQAVPGIGNAVRESEETRKNAPPPAGPGTPVLPRLVEPPFTLKDKETLLVRHFVVEDDRLVDAAEVREILEPYENRKLTLAQIYEAADKVTTLYRTKGYLLAKAYVPAQDARRGVLRIKLVPGRYGAITLKNESLVRESYLRGVIDHGVAPSEVVHKDALERTMLLMSDLPGGGMPRVAIGAGRQPETTDIVFGVPEARRFDGYLLGDNYGSPYTGRNRLTGGLNLNAPLGYGDRLSAFGIVSEETHLLNGRVAYSVPLGYDGLRAEVGAFRTTYVLGGVYKDLNATGTADALTATLSYPLRRRQDDSIYLSANFTHKVLNDNILDVSVANRRIDLGTATITRDTLSSLIGLPLTTSTALSFTAGYVNFPDAAQRAANIAGADTVGNYSRVNLAFNATVAFSDKVSLSTSLRAQRSLSGNLDSSEQMGLTGSWGVRSFDEGLSGDTGFLVTPELKYALPEIFNYRHSIGLFTDVGGVWLANGAYTTLQKAYTQLNDIGLGYYATYEYSPARQLLFKAQVARTYGPDAGAQSYDKVTKALLQVGVTF